MEIKYPIIIVISLFVFLFFLLIPVKKLKTRSHKRKVANTFIVKNSEQFKKIIRKYKTGLYIMYSIIFVCILSGAILSSRIFETQTIENNIYNRDIILCMDVSASVDKLNAEIVDSYKDIVRSLNGERFGISIFNTTSSLVVPLTEDYDYVIDSLETISRALSRTNSSYTTDDYLYLYRYLTYGTVIGAEVRGSSLAGDGLASCIFDFPNLEEDRSRIIIFSTDNDVAGEEYINVEDAAKIAKSKNITVYVIAPTLTYSKDAIALENASKTAGGKYYIQGKDNINNVINEIEQKEKTLLEGTKIVVETDYPTIPFIIMIFGFILLLIIDKVVLSW